MGSKTVNNPPPPAPEPADQAAKIQQAKNTLDPQSAQTSYNILSNPNYGLEPTTQLFENTRQNVFPQETAVRNQLAYNIFQNLASPTGISQGQQAGIDSRRQVAQNNLVSAFRDRANLGGNLYGGRSAYGENQAVGDLQNQFAEEDITRQERAHLNSIQAALPFLQILFPDVNLTPPQFQSAVQTPDTYANALTAQRGQDTSFYNAQNAANAQQQSALYQALGQGAAGAAGGLGAAFCFVAAEVFNGWDDVRTIHARHFISCVAPRRFKRFYIKHGERIARFIHNKKILKLAIKPLFLLFVSIDRNLFSEGEVIYG